MMHPKKRKAEAFYAKDLNQLNDQLNEISDDEFLFDVLDAHPGFTVIISKKDDE